MSSESSDHEDTPDRGDFDDAAENVPEIPVRVSTARGKPQVHRVGVKVPPFYPGKPSVWFKQLEGQFKLAGIKVDETKFYYATSQLEPPYVDIIDDIIENPPETDMYETFKRELISRLTKSKEKKVLQLLTHEELGDRKPSQFLRHLQNLAGPGVPDDFIKTVWSSRLPNSTQAIIAAQPSTSLKVLADLADRVHDVVPSFHQVASTSKMTKPVADYRQQASTSAPPQQNSMEFMARQIADLTKQVSALATQVRESRPRSRLQRSQPKQRRSSSGNRSQSSYRKYPTCWYHARFGEAANRCVKPCDFKSENCPGSR